VWRGLLLACSLSPLVARAGLAGETPSRQAALIGAWRGHALRAGARLELSIRFHREQGTLRATLSSPDLLLLDAPLEGVSHVGRNVRFSSPDETPVRFHGVLEGDSIRGTAHMPAVPGVAAADGTPPSIRFALGRAATPATPPYSIRDLKIPSGGVQLGATLLLPPGAGRRPGIVLLPGSSSRRRRDLAFHADHFARAGLAVLVFDKRGTGETPGEYRSATYEQLARDAANAVEFLRRQPGVDAARVGLWGLSQGALLAPMVAAQVPELRFLVGISAPGIPLGESAAYQDSIRLAAAGFDAADIRRMVTIQRRMSAWLQDGRDQAELAALLAEASSTPWRRASALPSRLPEGAALEGWYWRGRALDPEPAWRSVTLPVLLVYGAADELLQAKPNARAVERALRKGRNRDVTVRIFPAANHVLRTLPDVAGGSWDWPRPAPGYLELVTGWILERVR
jgi:hypothetical protein